MLWIGQFGIAGGQALEETPWVGVFAETPAAYRSGDRGADSSDLFLIVEPATAGSAEFCAELKEAVGSVFHKSKVSLTGGLLRALKAAHENLRDWNRRSIKEQRVAAGVSCLAVQGQEAYLAQVAPAAAVFYAGGTAKPIRPQLPDAAEPLGLYDEFWPEFSRFELRGGERLLLLTPGLADRLSEDDLATALALPAEEVLPALYRRAHALDDCGALLVAALPESGGTDS